MGCASSNPDVQNNQLQEYRVAQGKISSITKMLPENWTEEYRKNVQREIDIL